MEIVGIVIASVALLAGIVFGSYHIVQSERHKNDFIKALADTKIQLGDCMGSDLKVLGEVTLKAIEKNGDITIKAIEKDGAESRNTILSVHKSIKEELGNISIKGNNYEYLY